MSLFAKRHEPELELGAQDNRDFVKGFDEGFTILEEKDLCYIDDETVKVLELLENNIDSSNRRHSLLGYLNLFTATTTGTRLLREVIRRPLCHLKTLEHRLDCIEFLINRVDTLSNISNNIRRFGQNIDLDNVSPVLVNLFKARSDNLNMAEKRLDAITNVEGLVSQVPNLVSVLESVNCSSFNIYRLALEDPAYQEIINEIYEVIEPEVKTYNKSKRNRMFRIKQGVEPLFDIARSTYTAAINDLEQYVRELQTEDGLNWKLMYAESRGYYLTLYLDKSNKDANLTARYIKVNKTRNMITCTTPDLMQSNVRANVSYENSMKLANEILTNVISSIMNNMVALNKLVDIVGMLDLVTSFAKIVSNSNGSLTRPKFTSNCTVLEKSKHPVLETVLKLENLTVVPNDVMLKENEKNFMLVTGPNMGGKSIFLKQVGLIQIMAQIGCYVPAESAHIKLMNRIVARSGTTDDNQSNCSSFMWEMRGIASALYCKDETSAESVLYLIDEVGRGTSIEDGTSYSFAIAEELAQRRYSFTIFATHFQQVFNLPTLYMNVSPYYFKCEEERDRITGEPRLVIGHNLVAGLAEKYHYGIKIAQNCDLPMEIIRAAMKEVDL